MILRLPDDASKQLPTRGQVMVVGTMNNVPFSSPLEPDGKGSHWLHISPSTQNAIRAKVGDTVAVSIEPTTDWIEPTVPADVTTMLASRPQAHILWKKITPLARWEWIRWIRSTNSEATRKRRIEVACSKLESNERRPCCWNRNLSTEPYVSKNGVLQAPES